MDDPKAAAKRIRNTREVEGLLRQFLKMETGLGKNAAYQRGHVWNFEWCSSDPEKAQPAKVAEVNRLMDKGLPFDEAFDLVVSCKRHPSYGQPICQKCERSVSPLNERYVCEHCAAWP